MPRRCLAMDGYTLHARLNADGAELNDLDECRGHETVGLGYHYHANEPGKNAILAAIPPNWDVPMGAVRLPVMRPSDGGRHRLNDRLGIDLPE